MDLQDFDASYLERLKAGDPETESHFVAYFGQLLLLKLRSRLRSRHLVEDVRQETFLRVLRALRSEGIRHPERLGAFVNAVCNNVLLEVYSAQERQRVRATKPAPLPPPDIPDPESSLITEERKEAVRTVIGELSGRDRKVLAALFLEEREKDEVCEQMGVDRDYLRVLLYRAKTQFRSAFLERESRTAPAAPRPARMVCL